MKVQLTSYGNYSNKNYNIHAMCLILGDLRLYFSYNTVIAFKDGNNEIIISKNIWSNTTGKHLNDIDRDKSKRINNNEFNIKLKELLEKHNIQI